MRLLWSVEHVFHACNNRGCPRCQGREREKWIEARKAELLPVPYFHVVFTVPMELRQLIRRHQRILLSILMKAAAHALLKLGADPKYVGGTLGFLVVLHTWGGALVYHPHVHCLIPGGAFNKQGQTWNRSRNDYLVPVKALSPIFRAKFLDLAAKELPDLALPYAAGQKKWVVYSKPTGQSPDKVVEYLGRYVFRAAMTNARILEVGDNTVTFRYKKWRGKKKKGARAQWRTMQLPIFEFIRRFLQYTLPRGFHKVRYYGLLSPVNKLLRQRIQFSSINRSPTRIYSRFMPSRNPMSRPP